MASFQIYQDKENSSANIPARAKNAKQPLGSLNTNQINQKKNAKPFGEEVKIPNILPKKSNEVIEQLETISLPKNEVYISSTSTDREVIEVFNSDTEQRNDEKIQRQDTTISPVYEELQYQKDILANCREGEIKNRPKPRYMDRQADICHKMRSVLVDWLVKVVVDYRMDTETLYLSVSYIDRFLSQVSVRRSILQLVGSVAWLIACKFEETEPPKTTIEDIVYITDASYTREEILHMERFMLKVLSFQLMTPTAYAFVHTYAIMCDDMTQILKSLTLYIAELSLLKGDPFLAYLPSLISSAALALARHILGMEMWSPQLEKITTYKLKDLRIVVLALSSIHKSAKGLQQQAIQNKYKGMEYQNVAEIDDIELTHGHFDLLCLAYETKHSTGI